MKAGTRKQNMLSFGNRGPRSMQSAIERGDYFPQDQCQCPCCFAHPVVIPIFIAHHDAVDPIRFTLLISWKAIDIVEALCLNNAKPMTRWWTLQKDTNLSPLSLLSQRPWLPIICPRNILTESDHQSRSQLDRNLKVAVSQGKRHIQRVRWVLFRYRIHVYFHLQKYNSTVLRNGKERSSESQHLDWVNPKKFKLHRWNSCWRWNELW